MAAGASTEDNIDRVIARADSKPASATKGFHIVHHTVYGPMTAGVPSTDAAMETASTVSVRYQPKSRALRGYMLFYGIASLGIALFLGSVTGILLPLHVQQLEFAHLFSGIDAHLNLQTLNELKTQVDAGLLEPTADQHRLLGLLAQFNSARASSLSLVTSVGMFTTMLIQPVVGMLSDLTRSKWGRRVPWIAAGAVVGAALAALLPASPTIAILVIVWSLAQLVVSIAQGPLLTTVVDRVPKSRIGAASAVTGLIAFLGAIGGSLLAGSLFAAMGLAAYLPIALMLVLTVLSFVLFARDRSSAKLAVEPLRIRTFFDSYVRAFADRDFRWAWIAKVLLYIGFGIVNVYTIYMLQSYVTPALSASQALQIAPLMSFASLPPALIGMVLSGRWSDKIGRRKPFVIVSSVIMALAFLIPLAWPTLAALFVAVAVAGFGMGTFVVVDQALFIELLPDPESTGRDLGVATLGGNLGQAIGPALAGGVVVSAGGNYGAVWPVAFIVALAAGFAIIPIKRVR